jgi:hypothetical protein
MAPQLIEAVQRLTERTVRTFMSGMDEHGNSQVEVFILEPESGPDAIDPTPAAE